MQASQPSGDIVVPRQDGNRPVGPARDRSEAESRKSIYVWELPVRIMHWVNVITLGILTVTGIYIANPFIVTNGEATNQYLMGSMRFVHFVAAFVFTGSVLFRLYWAFVGNKYASWRQLIPAKSARRRGMRRMLAFYLFLRRDPPAVVGHNPLAGMAYTVVLILFLLQIIPHSAVSVNTFLIIIYCIFYSLCRLKKSVEKRKNGTEPRKVHDMYRVIHAFRA